MPKIDFYLINEEIPKSILTFVCRILEKAYTQDHQIYVHVPDDVTAHQLNELLWTFRDISFIPHCISGEKQTIIPPIEIGFENHHRPTHHHDVLVNLDTNIPPFFADFDRIIEIVSGNDDQKKKARNKYRQYKQQDYEIKTNDLTKRYS